jgi:putative redox protein
VEARARPGVRKEGGDVATIEVLHAKGDRFLIEVRDHVLVVDQPRDEGGDDVGPTPTELFVSALASCVAFFARRFLDRHDLPVDGLRVRATYHLSDRPARVGSVEVEVRVPAELDPGQRSALMAVVSHCTVHNSIQIPPSVSISVEERSTVGVGA